MNEPFVVTTIPISLLLTRLLKKTYQNLQNVLEKTCEETITDKEKKAVLLEWADQTRKQWIRLLVLLLWSRKEPGTANEYSPGHLAILRGQLQQHDELLRIVADNMFYAQENALFARAPCYDIHTAVDVLTTGQYIRLPTCIEKIVNHATNIANNQSKTLSKEKEKKVYDRLHDLIQYRLFSDNIPTQYTKIRIENGRAYCLVENEFEVQLTLIMEGAAAWRILDIQFFVQPIQDTHQEQLVDVKQIRIIDFVHKHIFSSNTENSLWTIYQMLHYFCLSIGFNILKRQARLFVHKQQNAIQQQADDQQITIIYWKTAPHNVPVTTGANHQLNVNNGAVAATPISADVNINQLNVNDLNPFNYIRIKKASDSKNGSCLQIEHHTAFGRFPACPIVEPVNLSQLSVEQIILRITSYHAEQVLSSLYQSLLKNKQILQKDRIQFITNSNSHIHNDSDIHGDHITESSLRIQLFGNVLLAFSIDCYTGLFTIRSSVNDSRISILRSHAENTLNKQPDQFMNILVELYYETVQIYIEHYMKFLQTDIFHTLPLRYPSNTMNNTNTQLQGPHSIQLQNNKPIPGQPHVATVVSNVPQTPIVVQAGKPNSSNIGTFTFPEKGITYFRLRDCNYFLALELTARFNITIVLFNIVVQDKSSNVMTVENIWTLYRDKPVSDLCSTFFFPLDLTILPLSGKMGLVGGGDSVLGARGGLPNNITLPGDKFDDKKPPMLKHLLDFVIHTCQRRLITELAFTKQLKDVVKISHRVVRHEIEFNLPNCEPLKIKKIHLAFHEGRAQWEVTVLEERNSHRDLIHFHQDDSDTIFHSRETSSWNLRYPMKVGNSVSITLDLLYRDLKGICRTVELADQWIKIKRDTHDDTACQLLTQRFTLHRLKHSYISFNFQVDECKHVVAIYFSGTSYTIKCSPVLETPHLFKRLIESNINLTRDLKSALQTIWRTTKPAQIVLQYFTPSGRVLPTDFTLIPQSSDRLRVLYRHSFGIDIRFAHDDQVLIDDAALALFPGHSLSMKPLVGLHDALLGLEERKPPLPLTTTAAATTTASTTTATTTTTTTTTNNSSATGAQAVPKYISHSNLPASFQKIHKLMGCLSLHHEFLRLIEHERTAFDITERQPGISFKPKEWHTMNIFRLIIAENLHHLDIVVSQSAPPFDFDVLKLFVQSITSSPYHLENIHALVHILRLPLQCFQNMLCLLKSHIQPPKESTQATLCMNTNVGLVVDNIEHVVRFVIRCNTPTCFVDFPLQYFYRKDTVAYWTPDGRGEIQKCNLERVVKWLESLDREQLVSAKNNFVLSTVE